MNTIKIGICFIVGALLMFSAGCASRDIEVHFYLNDDTDNLFTSITGNPQGGLFMPNGTPERQGYLFNGWFLDREGTLVYDGAAKEDLSVYAHWSPQTEAAFIGEEHTLTLHLGGGQTLTFTVTEPLLEMPETPSREGYTFGGWFEDEALTVPWNFTSDAVAGDMDLYARWIEPSPAPTAAPTPEPTPTPARTHKPSTPKPSATIMPITPTIEPIGTPPPVYDPGYSVYFNSNGGSAMGAYTNVPYNSVIAPPPNPNKNGFAFVNWYKEPSLSNVWNFSADRVYGNITLYAMWEAIPNNVTITYDTGGGEPMALPVTVIAGTSITLPNEPVLPGYTFVGWYTAKSGGNLAGGAGASYMPYASATLYARWQVSPAAPIAEIPLRPQPR